MSVSASSVAGALPRPRTRLIGRDAERAFARDVLVARAMPLLTLTGPGGVGKTRLAVAIAGDAQASFAEGVAWVDLAALADPALVPATVVTALGLIPAADRPPLDVLVRHLHPRQTLLLLDNCEHVLAACADLVSTLLDRCPALQVQATSRAPLRLHGEHVLPVDPLPLPDDESGSVAALQANEAVQLFVERAQAVQPTFRLAADNAPSISAICRRLDGLPLAIELAAARLTVISPAALLALVSDRLRVLTGGPRDAPSRQQTMREAIAWSYDLLTPDEQSLLRRVAVFAGGFEPSAAVAVATAAGGLTLEPWDGLTALLDASLLRRQDPGPGTARLGMLETIRAYGLERLAESGEASATRRAHAEHFAALAEAAHPHLLGPDQVAWLDRLEMEHDNVRLALTWADEHGEPNVGLRLAGSLTRFWHIRGHGPEGRVWLERALVASETAVSPERTRALAGAGVLAGAQGDLARATALHEQALAMARAQGQTSGVIGALSSLGIVANRRGDFERASAWHEEALAVSREAGDARGVAAALGNLGCVARDQGEFERATAFLEEALGVWRAVGDIRGIAAQFGNLGNVARGQGDLARAAALYEEALALDRALGDKQGVAIGLGNLGTVARERGDHVQAERWYTESLTLRQEIGDQRGVASTLSDLGSVARTYGQLARAATLYGQALALAHELGHTRAVAAALEGLAATAVVSRPAAATRRFGAATALRDTSGVARPAAHTDRGRFVTATRGSLGAAAFAAAWSAGEALPLERAIAEARALGAALASPLLAEPAPARAPDPPPAIPFGLTPREAEVLSLLCQRLTNKEIADALFVSPRTVQTHTISIFGKLGVANRRDAAAFAVRHGLA